MDQPLKVAVLMPSKGRAWQVRSRVSDLATQTRPADVTLAVVLAVSADDRATLTAGDILTDEFDEVALVVRAPGSTAVDGWMAAYRFAHSWGADWFVLGADDILWRPGWLAEALRVSAENRADVVGLNDGHTNLDDYAPHYMASRWFCEEHLGGRIIPEGYRCWWFDRHVCQMARMVGAYAPAWKAIAEHRHPDWKTAAVDQTYAEAFGDRELDKEVYQRWLTGVAVNHES